jgi:hypothetical protein
LRLYGLADRTLSNSRLGEVIELYIRREDAEQALADALEDEPAWSDVLYVVTIDQDPPSSSDSQVATH